MNVRLEPAAVRGFRFAGVAAGLRTERGRKDLGIIVADSPAPARSDPTVRRSMGLLDTKRQVRCSTTFADARTCAASAW